MQVIFGARGIPRLRPSIKTAESENELTNNLLAAQPRLSGAPLRHAKTAKESGHVECTRRAVAFAHSSPFGFFAHKAIHFGSFSGKGGGAANER